MASSQADSRPESLKEGKEKRDRMEEKSGGWVNSPPGGKTQVSQQRLGSRGCQVGGAGEEIPGGRFLPSPLQTGLTGRATVFASTPLTKNVRFNLVLRTHLILHCDCRLGLLCPPPPHISLCPEVFIFSGKQSGSVGRAEHLGGKS